MLTETTTETCFESFTFEARIPVRPTTDKNSDFLLEIDHSKRYSTLHTGAEVRSGSYISRWRDSYETLRAGHSIGRLPRKRAVR